MFYFFNIFSAPIYLKKLIKIQKTHVKPKIKNIQTEGEIKSKTQRDKDKNGKPKAKYFIIYALSKSYMPLKKYKFKTPKKS